MTNSFLLVLFIAISQFNLLQAADFSNGIKIEIKSFSQDSPPFCATKETALLICQEAGFDYLDLDDSGNLKEASVKIQQNIQCRLSPKSNDFISFRGFSTKTLNYVICYMKTAQTSFTNNQKVNNLLYRL